MIKKTNKKNPSVNHLNIKEFMHKILIVKLEVSSRGSGSQRASQCYPKPLKQNTYLPTLNVSELRNNYSAPAFPPSELQTADGIKLNYESDDISSKTEVFPVKVTSFSCSKVKERSVCQSKDTNSCQGQN